MAKITENTTISIGLVAAVVGGSWWLRGLEDEVKDLKKSVARIERHLGIAKGGTAEIETAWVTDPWWFFKRFPVIDTAGAKEKEKGK